MFLNYQYIKTAASPRFICRSKSTKAAATQTYTKEENTMSYLCIHIYRHVYMYVCMHLASGSKNTCTPDDGPLKRQES